MSCDKEKEIQEIKKRQDKLQDAIFGNGAKGLKTEVAELSIQTENLTLVIGELKDSNEKVASALSGINKFQVEWESREQERKEIQYKFERRDIQRKSNVRWIVSISLTVVLTLIGWIISLKSSNENKPQTTQTNSEPERK